MSHATEKKKGRGLPCTYGETQRNEGENDGANLVPFSLLGPNVKQRTHLRKKDAARFDLILASLPDPSRETWEQSLVRKAVLELRESLEQAEEEANHR